MLQVYEGQVLYRSEVRGQVYKVSSAPDKEVADNQWHNVTVTVKGEFYHCPNIKIQGINYIQVLDEV